MRNRESHEFLWQAACYLHSGFIGPLKPSPRPRANRES